MVCNSPNQTYIAVSQCRAHYHHLLQPPQPPDQSFTIEEGKRAASDPPQMLHFYYFFIQCKSNPCLIDTKDKVLLTKHARAQACQTKMNFVTTTLLLHKTILSLFFIWHHNSRWTCFVVKIKQLAAVTIVKQLQMRTENSQLDQSMSCIFKLNNGGLHMYIKCIM